ncbi:hypothetical protein ACFX1T_043919 [Malus domestica]
MHLRSPPLSLPQKLPHRSPPMCRRKKPINKMKGYGKNTVEGISLSLNLNLEEGIEGPQTPIPAALCFACKLAFFNLSLEELCTKIFLRHVDRAGG